MAKAIPAFFFFGGVRLEKSNTTVRRQRHLHFHSPKGMKMETSFATKTMMALHLLKMRYGIPIAHSNHLFFFLVGFADCLADFTIIIEEIDTQRRGNKDHSYQRRSLNTFGCSGTGTVHTFTQ